MRSLIIMKKGGVPLLLGLNVGTKGCPLRSDFRLTVLSSLTRTLDDLATQD